MNTSPINQSTAQPAEYIMQNTETAFTIIRINHYYRGIFKARQSEYVRQGFVDNNNGKILAFANRAAAQHIATALTPGDVYSLVNGEYAAPIYSVRLSLINPVRLARVTEDAAKQLLCLH